MQSLYGPRAAAGSNPRADPAAPLAHLPALRRQRRVQPFRRRAEEAVCDWKGEGDDADAARPARCGKRTLAGDSVDRRTKWQ
jgi:hypothetical protein